MNTKTVCMLSDLHDLFDDRIYWKEAVSLKKAGFNVIHIGFFDKEQDFVSEEGIRLITIKKKVFSQNILIHKLLKTITFNNPHKDMLRIAAKVKADVYHIHDLKVNRIGNKLKRLLWKPKIIYDVHEPYPVTISDTETNNVIIKLFWKLIGIYTYYWELRSSRNYDLIITTEENVKNKFDHAHKNQRTEIIYNYVDRKIKPTPSLKEFDFIYSGGVRKRRGAFEMIDAINQIKRKNINPRLLIIGTFHDKGLKEKIIDFIRENKLENNIIIKATVPYSEIDKYYQKSKIGLAVFNNYSVNRIILPIKIFEYITYGLPVITSNFGHMKQITQLNNTGICIDPKNKDEFTNAMLELLQNNAKYEDLKHNCIRAADNYKWSNMEIKLINLYLELLK